MRQPNTFRGPPGFKQGLGSPRGLGQGTIDEIEDLIEQLPEADAEEYAARLKGCLEQLGTGGLPGVLSGYKCLSSLYDDARAAVKAAEEGKEKPKVIVRDPDPKPKPDEGTSPWLVAGGLAALGVVGYLALK